MNSHGVSNIRVVNLYMLYIANGLCWMSVWLLFLSVKCICCKLVGLSTICHLMDVGQFESLSNSH